MADLYVWTSTNAELIAEFEAWQRARGEFSRDSERLVRKWFGRRKRGRVISTGHWPKWHGVEALGEEWRTPPEGWRYDSRRGCLVPFRTRKEGKAIAKEMDACRMPDDPKITGMPGFIMDSVSSSFGILMRGPSVALIDGVLWCTWKVDLKAKRTAKPKTDRWYDPKIWTRAKLSDYYAAVEARDETAMAS